MKDQSHISAMLRRAEQRRRKGLREGNDRKMYESAYAVKLLKIVLEIPKNTGRQRLRKDRQDMDKLLGVKK